MLLNIVKIYKYYVQLFETSKYTNLLFAYWTSKHKFVSSQFNKHNSRTTPLFDTTKPQNISCHVIKNRPIFSARRTIAVKPISKFQLTSSGFSWNLGVNWTVIFANWFTRCDGFHCFHYHL